MRVALFSDTFPPDINGVATSVGLLYKTLKDNGDDVLVITSNSIDNKSSYDGDLIRLKGIRFKRLYNYVIPLHIPRKYKKIIKDFKPDVCHMHTDGPMGQYGWLLAKRYKSKPIYTYHTDIEDYTHYVTGGWFFDKTAKAIVRAYVRHKCNKSKGLIVPSEKTKAYLSNLKIKNDINIVPTGIDFSQFKETDEDKTNALRKELGINEDDYVVLYLGRLAKEKTIDFIIEAFDKYLDKYPNENIKLVIAGGGPDLKRLMAIAKSLNIEDKVRFSGSIPPSETPYYYHLGDCFVSASITETQGLTYMEALGASLPLIARYDESIKDLIHDGEDGFIYKEQEELVDIIHKVKNLDEKERENIIENGYKSLEPYSLETFYSSISEVYKKAINE